MHSKKIYTQKTLCDMASDLEAMTVQIDRVKSLIALSFGVFDECPQLHDGFGHYYEATLASAASIANEIAKTLESIATALYKEYKEERQNVNHE